MSVLSSTKLKSTPGDQPHFTNETKSYDESRIPEKYSEKKMETKLTFEASWFPGERSVSNYLAQN